MIVNHTYQPGMLPRAQSPIREDLETVTLESKRVVPTQGRIHRAWLFISLRLLWTGVAAPLLPYAFAFTCLFVSCHFQVLFSFVIYCKHSPVGSQHILSQHNSGDTTTQHPQWMQHLQSHQSAKQRRWYALILSPRNQVEMQKRTHSAATPFCLPLKGPLPSPVLRISRTASLPTAQL